MEHVRGVVQKFSNQARIFDHQSSNGTKTILTLDTKNGIFEIFIGPDERESANPDFVKRKLKIQDGKEKWQFQR